MAIIDSLPSPAASTSIRNPRPDLVSLLSQKDTLWRQVCKICGAGWPWAYFERNADDGLRDFTQEVCERCVNSEAERGRWQAKYKEMEALVEAQRALLPGSSKRKAAAIADMNTPVSMSSPIMDDPPLYTGAVVPLPGWSRPSVLATPTASTSTWSQPAAKLPLTPASAGMPEGPEVALKDLPEPERARRWILKHYKPGTTIPHLTQIVVYRQYQETFRPQTSLAQPLGGSEFVQLVQEVFPSVYLIPDGYAFGGLEEIKGEGVARFAGRVITGWGVWP